MSKLNRVLRIGVAGLGRAFSLMAPTFRADARVRVVAGADPRAEARAQFENEYGRKAHASVEALCTDPEVDVVYIATPHQFHAANACAAAAAGKHLLVEKPMALTLDECRTMIAAARKANVQMVVGHSHSFDAPIRRTRALIESGMYGRVRMIHSLYYTDFLYRPRRPEELDTSRGGGAIFNQAAHQVDVARLLAGSALRSVRASAGAWDDARPTEGAYSALFQFEDGTFASLVYSGYAHFDADELMGWIGEGGQRKDPSAYGAARRQLQGDELSLKNARNYGGSAFRAPASTEAQPHFGFVIVSCERADLRPMPNGVMIYADAEQRLDPLPPPAVPRSEVIDELYGAVVNGIAPLHDGEWAMATLEACLALLSSAKEGREVAL